MRFCWANWLFIIVVAILSLSSLLTSCGKTGDLYLPENESQQQR
ncbi:MAG: lipoprotein [Gammaproteobacteria bacterium]|nr:lipoprotein [Gammaproteobacteria bacterium]